MNRPCGTICASRSRSSAPANELLLRQQKAETPIITRAREFIRQHQTEPLRLDQMARAVNVSRFYFYKQFKKATGLGFTELLACGRVERAKALLLNPQKRISQAPYEAGSHSLTHFKRSFRRFAGQSPTQFRAKRTRLLSRRGNGCGIVLRRDGIRSQCRRDEKWEKMNWFHKPPRGSCREGGEPLALPPQPAFHSPRQSGTTFTNALAGACQKRSENWPH